MVDDDENEVGKENLSDCVFISSSSKPKGNGIYTYKKQSVTLKLGKTIKFYAMDSRDQSKSIFDGVLHTQNFMEGDFEGIDQQISLTTVGSEESSAYLMVSILTDKDEAETHSYSSKNSRRSLKNRRKHKGGHPAPSLQEESFEDIREDDLDDDMDDAGDAGEDPFIKYEDTKTKLKKFEDGDGFDVFVDAARFLPDNATVTKISVKAYSKSGKAVGGDEKIGYCDLGSALLNPKFSDCRKEFRGDKFDPTATLMVRLDTFEEDIQKVRAVGYGLLNLFTMLDDRKKQPENANEQEFGLNVGCFQIPVYKHAPNVKTISGDQLNGTPNVSCTTVLVRIKIAPKSADGLTVLSREDFEESEWEKNGLINVAPLYSEVVYDNTRCLPNALEEKLYQLRRHRADVPLREYVLKEVSKLNPDRDIGSIKEEEMREYIQDKVAEKPRNMLNYTKMAPYAPGQNMGSSAFKISIDGLYKMPGGGMFGKTPFYKAVYSLNPGLYYSDPPMFDEAHFTRGYVLSSDQTCPRFDDGWCTFNDIAIDDALSAIIEVRTVTHKKEYLVSEQSVSLWGILPILNGNYVNSGVFSLPLFEGKVPQAVLESARPYEFIVAELKKKPKERKVNLGGNNGELVIARLSDTLVSEYEDPAWTYKSGLIDTRYSDIVARAASKPGNFYEYNGNLKIKKTVEKLCGKDGSEVVTKALNKAMAKATNITHYVLD